MILTDWLNTFVMLFVVIDPIGVAAMFGLLTRDSDPGYRRTMALKGSALSAAILLFFVFSGGWLLNALGISLAAFKVAGGFLLFLLSIDMVFARQSGLRSTTAGERAEAREKADISVFPLAFPMIAGPGALTTVLLLQAEGQGDAIHFAAVMAALALVLSLTCIVLLAAGPLLRILGETGINVVDRLFGVILAALAAQYVMDGVQVALGITI